MEKEIDSDGRARAGRDRAGRTRPKPDSFTGDPDSDTHQTRHRHHRRESDLRQYLRHLRPETWSTHLQSAVARNRERRRVTRISERVGATVPLVDDQPGELFHRHEHADRLGQSGVYAKSADTGGWWGSAARGNAISV